MSESLRNDGRVWVPKHKDENRHPSDIPDEDRDYFLERIYPSFGNLVPRDVASRNAKNQADIGKGVGATKVAVYLDFADAIKTGNTPEVDGVEGLKDEAICMAVFESAWMNQPVSVSKIENCEIEDYQKEINDSLGL